MISESEMAYLRKRVAEGYEPSKGDFRYAVEMLDKARYMLVLFGVATKAKTGKVECVWREDEDGNWEADCGGMHTFIEGCPYENRHAFCPYCGRMLVSVPAS